MPDQNDNTLRITLSEATERLTQAPESFVVLFTRGEFSVELYAPKHTDSQTPHEQDEVYIVAAGSGVFQRGEERISLAPSDFLFVEAGVSHRFEQFTEDFQTWVFFFGPKNNLPG
jgi:mannose-6-phosphate isomerase-like protein (cupin superfamily)